MQFLDLAGLNELWSKIKAGDAAAKTTLTEQATSSQTTGPEILVTKTAQADGHDNYVLSLNRVASPNDIEEAMDELYGGDGVPASNPLTLTSLDQAISDAQSAGAVTISEAAGSGDVLKVYTFTQNGSQIGAVNIPRDFLVKSGKVREATAADSGFDVGEKILDFTVNSVEGSGSESHILISVSDLVDAYTGGNGIEVSNANVISAKIDSTSEDFLSVGAGGIKLDGVQDAIDEAAAAVVGDSNDVYTDDTVYGAKAYANYVLQNATAELAVSAQGDSYVSAAVDANNNKKINVAATAATQASLALADSALQGVDSTPAGSNVQVTLGVSGKNVTVSVSESGLSDALDHKADKVASATSGDFAGLDANGNLVDSGSKASDFATAAQGALADSAIQSVSGETAVSNSNYVAVSVEAATTGSAVALTSHANVTTHAVSSAVAGSADGLATAADVKSYVDSATGAIDTAMAALDADLDATGTQAHGGVFVMSGVTQVDGKLTAVDSVEVEAAGAAAAAQAAVVGDATSAGNTLGKLEDRLDVLEGGASGSIADQIDSKINALDSAVNNASATGNVNSTNDATNNGSASANLNDVNVLKSITVVDGKITAATGETIGAIPVATVSALL